MKYNNPGLVVDFGVGLAAWPLPMDINGDSKFGLVVNCLDKPSNGVYVLANAVDTTQQAMPMFEPGVRISKGLQNVELSTVGVKSVVRTPATRFPDFAKTGLEFGQKLSLPANVHANKVRANIWKLVDFDGDGVQDIIVGCGDWTDYSWDNADDAQGKWTCGPLRGFIYSMRNKGTNAQPDYASPVKVEAAGKPIETFGWHSPNFVDFDGDGIPDFLGGAEDGSFYFLQNPLWR